MTLQREFSKLRCLIVIYGIFGILVFEIVSNVGLTGDMTNLVMMIKKKINKSYYQQDNQHHSAIPLLASSSLFFPLDYYYYYYYMNAEGKRKNRIGSYSSSSSSSSPYATDGDNNPDNDAYHGKRRSLHQPQRQQQQKTTVSVSIDSNMLDEIKAEAESKHVSLNATINRILSKHAIFYRHAEEQQSMVLTNKNFRLFVDCIDEKILLDTFNENSCDLIPTIFNQRNIPLTLDNIIEYCYKGIGLFAGTFHDFSYYKDKEDDHLCLLFRHNFGIKWSRVLAAGIAYQIESTLGYHVIPVSILISSVLLKIVEKV
jgi:uncharacterized protein (DUF4415 family)